MAGTPRAHGRDNTLTVGRRTDEAVLRVLLDQGPASRAQLARLTGLSKPTVAEAAERLLHAGVIADRGQHRIPTGHSMTLFEVNPRYGHALGVSIERGHIAVRALDFCGQVAGENRVETRYGDDVPAALARARDLIKRTDEGLDSPRRAISLAIAAPVDPRTATTVDWPNSPFTAAATDFRSALDLPEHDPLLIDNDVNWAALAEHRLGSMRDTDDFLYVYLGPGIGAALVIAGRVHRGVRGMAGEIGFLRGENGEALIHHLTRTVIGTRDGWGGSIDTDRATALFEDPESAATTDPIIDDLARAISNTATVIDPAAIVLGGPLAQSKGLVDALRARITPIALTGLPITATSIGRDGPLYGAAIGALEHARRPYETRQNGGQQDGS